MLAFVGVDPVFYQFKDVGFILALRAFDFEHFLK
jgi:hypothetical protein